MPFWLQLSYLFQRVCWFPSLSFGMFLFHLHYHLLHHCSSGFDDVVCCLYCSLWIFTVVSFIFIAVISWSSWIIIHSVIVSSYCFMYLTISSHSSLRLSIFCCFRVSILLQVSIFLPHISELVSWFSPSSSSENASSINSLCSCFLIC